MLSCDIFGKVFFLIFYFQADNGVFNAVDWDGWLYGLGMPPAKPK